MSRSANDLVENKEPLTIAPFGPPSLLAKLRIVVTLGTMPSRNCTTAVASLLNQTRLPDALYVTAPKYNELTHRPSRIPPELQSVGGSRLHILEPQDDRGPAEKYLSALSRETDPSTIIIVVDDDWRYPVELVRSLAGAILAHESRLGSHQTVAVGGSGTRLQHNLRRFHVSSPGVPCAQQLVAPHAHTAVFASALPAGCHVPVDSLQGFAGIAFRRSAVELTKLVDLVSRAPRFLRYSDDLILAAHLASRGIARWLVDSPIPALLAEEAKQDALHGGWACDVRPTRPDGTKRTYPGMLTNFQLSLRWLRQHEGVWGSLKTGGLRHVGVGCLSPQLLDLVGDRPYEETSPSQPGWV